MDQRCCHPIPAALLLTVGTLALITPTISGLVREHYVAAVTVDWDYSNGQDPSSDNVFKKIVYKEYEKGFIALKRASKLSGILGPTLRAEVGDTLKVHFRNMATKPLTIHPQGITYGKLSEGVNYADGTSSIEKLDDSVLPGQTYTYSWDITEDMGPKEDDPDCLTSIYYSAENMVQDVNSGLIGAMLICKTGILNNDGTSKNFNKEFVLLFAVFDESKSWQESTSTKEKPVKYTINGYAKGTGPDFKACIDDKINWHLLGMSSKPEIFSIHFFGQTLNEDHHRVSVVSLASSASTSANMTATQSGKWKISSLNIKHIEAEMQAYLDVETCSSKEWRKPVYQTRFIKSWDHYIAAVEVDWDYAYRSSDPTTSSSCHQTFKKVIYQQYKDSTFTSPTEPERSRRELGLIGPVIRAQVKDTIMVVFKNMASQPHNLYPHGVSLQRFFKGYVPDLKVGVEIQNNTVMPGETVTYYWTVLDIDEPTKNDPQCLTRIYHSTVNIVKDMASGLLGTLLICKSMALNTRGLQEKADEEQIAMFAVFDENKSWYYEVNKLKACSWMLAKDPKVLYNYYVINTINGNSLENAVLGFCYNHVVQWHVSSVGIWDETLTIQLSGHTFRYRRGAGDLVTLFPMTSESIITEMNNLGVWLFGNFNFNEKPGMNVRFRDVKCLVPVDYEDFVDEELTFNYYPDVRTNSEEEEDDDENNNIFNTDEDDYSAWMAEQFNIRSRKNNTGAIEENLNLTALAIDEAYETSNTNLDVSSNRSTSGSYDIDSSDSSEEEFNKNATFEGDPNVTKKSSLDVEYVVPTSTSNFTEGSDHIDTLHSAIPDQREEIFNKTDVYMQDHKGTEADNEKNIIQTENYFEESTNGTQTEQIEVTEKTNSSKAMKLSVAKRDVEKAANYANMSFDLGHSKENNSKQSKETVPDNKTSQWPHGNEGLMEKKEVNFTWEERVPDNKTAQWPHGNEGFTEKREVNFTWEKTVPDNKMTQWPHGTKGFTEKNKVNSTAEVPLQTGSDHSPIDVNGDRHHTPSVSSPTFQPKSHPAYTTSTPTNTHTSTSTTTKSLGTTKMSIPDYYDNEIKELLGAHIFEEIMKSIMFEPQSNETVLEEDSELIATEEKIDDVNESGNQSNPSSNFIAEQSSRTEVIKKPPLIYAKKIEKFQMFGSGNNNNNSVTYLTLKKKAGYNTSDKRHLRLKKNRGAKGKEKRTANSSYNKLHSSNSSNFDNASFEISSNNENITTDNNITFSPRGFNMRTFSRKPEITIGAFRSNFEEYDAEPSNDLVETAKIMMAFEDPYKIQTADDVNRYTKPERIIENFLRTSKGMKRIYYIAAEEVQWDYSGRNIRGTTYKKVIFRQYLDITFKKPVENGEYEEHLGILGPVIRAEVEDVIQVTFKNSASRPYSIHAHGVSYEKSSEGYSYADETEQWLRGDDSVKNGDTHVYVWFATKQSGPESEASACRTWAYHSGVNIEKDIHSGLIGPLLICRNGTLDKQNYRPLDAREFVLMFMTFEEEKSWYFDKTKNTCTEVTEKPAYETKCHTFHAINGIIYNLQGLQMYQNESVRWHLLNMGNTKDIHVIHFHGQTIIENLINEHRHAVYPLIPGSVATVEMRPSKAGVWQLNTEVAEYQQAGMQALFHIADAECNFPLGMENRLISDDQIIASHYIDKWEPKLARLNNAGSFNAWNAHLNLSSLPWIQVDLLKPYLISGIQTQGANKYFSQYYITEFFVVYSKNKRKWQTFKGNSTASHKIFQGNSDSSTIKENRFDPPIVARYIRLFPTRFYNQPALRMELLGCEIYGCSAPLGMENNRIKDQQITASSYKSSWYSSPWVPSLARLNKAGSVNAWQAKSNNNQQWLQIDLLTVKKITAIITQGAKQFTSEMYVQSYGIHYSDDGRTWKSYIDDSTSMEKIFRGNSNSAGYAKNYFNPPIFTRFLKIIPKSWNQAIVMRVELYGCSS